MGCRVWMAALVALSAGCSWNEAAYRASAERTISQILSSKQYEAVDRWQQSAITPAPEKPPPAAPAPAVGKPQVFFLRDALRTATRHNRDFKSELESLELSALAASLQRRNFGPILSNTISYAFSNSPTATATGTLSAEIGVSKILPSGGTVEATSSGSVADPFEDGGPTTYGHDISISFDQPLLRGFGREVAYEDLTQAERDVVYALRDFELFRQDFSLRVLRRYYDILRQKQVVENSRRTLERFTFLKKRSEALFEVEKVSAIDKFRAAQEELTARNDLITEQEALAALLDEFKILLGIPTATRIDVADDKPAMRPVNIDLRSAIAAAIHNRLDLKTSAEQLEDAERNVRIARNGLLPELDLSASLGFDGAKAGGDRMSYAGSQSIELSLTLPLDKVADRNAYKQARITRSRRERALSLARASVRVDVLNTYRRLRRLANSVSIQDQNVKLAERRVKNAQLRFELGQLGNRDVVEAESAKLRAQNAHIRAILDHEVARLQLKRDIGILFIDQDGAWKE